MGYTLEIGNAYVDLYIGDGCSYASIDVENETHDEAPAYGEPTDYTNSRWPSYTSWREFVDAVDLYDLFYDEDNGLIREHPGQVPLTKYHQDQINNAMENYKKKFPNAVAGYSPKIDYSKGIYEDLDWPKENGMLVRLEWLKYWVDWALETCEKPIFKNT